MFYARDRPQTCTGRFLDTPGGTVAMATLALLLINLIQFLGQCLIALRRLDQPFLRCRFALGEREPLPFVGRGALVQA
jgi:hypothetical protein